MGGTDTSRQTWRESFWRRLLGEKPRARWPFVIAAGAMVAVIGAADFITGFELSMLVFYFIPVALAATTVGWPVGVGTALVSVGTWLAGDIAAGARYASPLIPIWNALIALSAYLVIVWLLANVMALHREMEDRVKQRTAALTEEIAERERLERVILEISERERRNIGHDLHDGLGQHLTGTALVAHALGEQLSARNAPEAAEMKTIVGLVEAGIDQTRSLAKGLLLAEVESEGLASALQEFAAATRSQHGVDCRFYSAGGIALAETGAATHVYRIAQEATRNAIRHGRAKKIAISLAAAGKELRLEVRDDGVGLPPPAGRGQGLGLRIMAHRAAMVGGRFSVEAQPKGGTLALCRLPLPKPTL
jgi:signal transduction histidine kinase